VKEGDRWGPMLSVAWLGAGLVHVALAFLWAPDPRSTSWADPIAFRIFFFHVPLAWSGYLAFGIVFAASIVFLRTRNARWDHLAVASAGVGVVLISLALVTGALWQEAETGEYWRWDDARLFTTFVLWLVYLAYVALRSTGEGGEGEARMAAIYGIVAFASVPISFFSVRLLPALHPPPGSREYMTPVFVAVLLVGVVVFTLLYLLLLRHRLALLKQALTLEEAKQSLEGA